MASVNIFVNHVGFLPKAPKFFVVKQPETSQFHLVNRANGQIVLEGILQRVATDLDEGWVGCFTELRQEGTYIICCGNSQSRVVMIYARTYEYPLRTLFNYFPAQRCGGSHLGWNGPCHPMDAKDYATGEHKELSGGWHQSNDLRKWSFGTIFALFGLVPLKNSLPLWDNGTIVDEIKWGCDYFQKMVREDGGLMDHVITPNGWSTDRIVYSNDAPPMAAFNHIIGLAMASRMFEKEQMNDPQRKCAETATTIWDYLLRKEATGQGYRPDVIPKYHEWLPELFSQNYPGSALYKGDKLYAALSLYRLTRLQQYLTTACELANELVLLQVGGDLAQDPASACFRVSADSDELASAYFDGFLGLLGMYELIEMIPDHSDAPKWRHSILLSAEQMCTMADKNPWGVIPSYWYKDKPDGGRSGGSGFYKYFYKMEPLRFGLNFDIAVRALFLQRAGRMLDKPSYIETAARQLDWILGCNPFDASTVEGVGNGQPERFINHDEFFPPVPQIPGAVMVGIIGDDRDEPIPLGKGNGVDIEYDMPVTAILMWLLTEWQA